MAPNVGLVVPWMSALFIYTLGLDRERKSTKRGQIGFDLLDIFFNVENKVSSSSKEGKDRTSGWRILHKILVV